MYEKSGIDQSFETPLAPEATATTSPDTTAAAPMETPPGTSAAVERFRSCRWRKAAENGTPECCGHRDVLPITGANGFDPGAWCPECAFYKLRRTPKKREYYDRY